AGGGRTQGGGINSAAGSNALVTDSTFIGNQAMAGGGSGGTGPGRAGALFNEASTMTAGNRTILNNPAHGGSNITDSGFLVGPAGGGGITNSDRGILILRGTTVSGNLALGGSNNTSTGGEGDIGTAFGGGLNNVGTVTITDCVFENNEARGG